MSIWRDPGSRGANSSSCREYVLKKRSAISILSFRAERSALEKSLTSHRLTIRDVSTSLDMTSSSLGVTTYLILFDNCHCHCGNAFTAANCAESLVRRCFDAAVPGCV